MEIKISKIDAALNQLDWAIKLFLDHQAFIPAITLAGAAEEIIGEVVFNKTGSSSFHILKNKLSKETGLEPKIISQEYLNKTKNWMKHWKDLKDNEHEEFDLEINAIQYLIRAIDHLNCFDRSCSSETPRFIKWLTENKKEFLDDIDPNMIEVLKTCFLASRLS